MAQADVRVPYNEVAAYNASSGNETMNSDSSGATTGEFTIRWDTAGFTGTNWNGPNGMSTDFDSAEATVQDWMNNGSLSDSQKLSWVLDLVIAGCANM